MMTLSRLGMCVTAKDKVEDTYFALSYLTLEYLKYLHAFSGQSPEILRDYIHSVCSNLCKEEVEYIAAHRASLKAGKKSKTFDWDTHPAFGGKETGIGDMLTAYGLRPLATKTSACEAKGMTLSAIVAIDILASSNRFHQGNVATLANVFYPAQEGFKKYLASIAERPVKSISEQERKHLVTLRAAGIDIFDPETEVALTVAMFIWEAIFLRTNTRVSHCECHNCVKIAEGLLQTDKVAHGMFLAVSEDERLNSFYWWMEPFLTKPVVSIALCMASPALNFLMNTGFDNLAEVVVNSPSEISKTGEFGDTSTTEE